MNDQIYKLILSFVSPDSISVEHTSEHYSIDDALEEADDLAFSNVGFPIEDWQEVDFGDENKLFLFYPNEEDRTSRFKLVIRESAE